MTVEVSEIRDPQAFFAQELEWNELLARSHFDVPFLRHEWLRTWWTHFSRNDQISVILARRDGRLAFAMPLLEDKISLGPVKLTALRSLTNTHSFRYHFLLERGREDVIEAVWDYLLQRDRRWHVLVLADVPMDVGIGEQLLGHVRSHGELAGTWHACESAYLAIDGAWADHEQKMAKSVRKQLRSQRNRLGRQGDVRLEVLTDPDEVAAALPEAFEIERRSWKGERGTAIACNPTLVGFYSELARIAARLGWMRLSFLRVDQTRAAFEYGLQYNRRFHSVKIGYDAERFRKFSTGRLLVMDSIVRCFDERLAEFDFIGPLTNTQAHWRPLTREIGWLFVYRNSLLSRLHYAVKFGINPLAKRVLGWLRPTSDPTAVQRR